MACALASPVPYVVSRSPAIQFSRSNTEILGQINQLNEDGTYTFGYESADGSFRVENRDIDGFVSGKYGYVDANGKVQEFGKFKMTFSLLVRIEMYKFYRICCRFNKWTSNRISGSRNGYPGNSACSRIPSSVSIRSLIGPEISGL